MRPAVVHTATVSGARAEVADRYVFWGCITLMCAGFVLPGLGQIGATLLLVRG